MSLKKCLLILGYSLTALQAKSNIIKPNCYSYNSDRLIKTEHQLGLDDAKISTNGKFAAGSNSDVEGNVLSWINLENHTKNEFKLNLGKNLHIVIYAINNDASQIFYQLIDRRNGDTKYFLKIFDTQKGADIFSFDWFQQGELHISPNQHLIAYMTNNNYSTDNIIYTFDLSSNTSKSFQLNKNEQLISISDKFVIISTQKYDFKIINLSDGTEKLIPNYKGYSPNPYKPFSALSSDQNHFAFSATNGDKYIIASLDLQTSKYSAISIDDDGSYFIKFFADSNKIYIVPRPDFSPQQPKRSPLRFIWDPESEKLAMKKVNSAFGSNLSFEFWSDGYNEKQVFSTWYQQTERRDDFCFDVNLDYLKLIEKQ